MYEKESNEYGRILVVGKATSILKTLNNEFICIKIIDEDLPYDIYGTGGYSTLPGSLVERILGPRYYALKEIKPTVKEIIVDYIAKYKDKFNIVEKPVT